MHDSVAIVSGGLDSTTLVYDMVTNGLTPHLLSFDYGQRHKKELTYAAITAKKFGLRHDIVDLSGLTHLISNSALTAPRIEFENANTLAQIEVPEGHYAEDNMKATVVPNRNMIMLSIAAGVMVNNNYHLIGTGVHAGDHFIYPDCRPGFIFACNAAIARGNAGFGLVGEWNTTPGTDPQGLIYAPFLEKSKTDIAYRALELGVPLHLTWSCYKGEDKHCGKCGTCVERLEAIHMASVRWKDRHDPKSWSHIQEDQTEYADDEFWRTATKQA